MIIEKDLSKENLFKRAEEMGFKIGSKFYGSAGADKDDLKVIKGISYMPNHGIFCGNSYIYCRNYGWGKLINDFYEIY